MELEFLLREWRFNSLLYEFYYPLHHSHYNKQCYILERRLDRLNLKWYRHMWDGFDRINAYPYRAC